MLNGVLAPRFEPGDLQAVAGQPSLEHLIRAQQDRVQSSEQAFERLKELKLPLMKVSRLFQDPLGRESILQIARQLEEGGLL